MAPCGRKGILRRSLRFRRRSKCLKVSSKVFSEAGGWSAERGVAININIYSWIGRRLLAALASDVYLLAPYLHIMNIKPDCSSGGHEQQSVAEMVVASLFLIRFL